jgi:hypothetical protein
MSYLSIGLVIMASFGWLSFRGAPKARARNPVVAGGYWIPGPPLRDVPE